MFEALEDGLWFFGGSPKVLVVDNDRTMVDSCKPIDFRWNRLFLELCGHYRMQPVPCLISFGGNRYSVPHPYAGKSVWVRVSRGKYLLVLDMRGQVVATHELCREKGRTVLDKQHYEGLRRAPTRTRPLLEKAFLEVERLRQQLRKLTLHTMAAIFEEEAEKAAKSQMSYTAFLARLADEEVAAKAERSINAKVAKARFPAIKTLELFDFSFQPSLPAAAIRELAELGFLDRAENVVLVGPSDPTT